MVYADGSTYEGMFRNDKPHGFGVFRGRDGSLYEGNFLEGKRSGKGKLILANGTVFQGIFKADQFVQKQ